MKKSDTDQGFGVLPFSTIESSFLPTNQTWTSVACSATRPL